MANHPSGAVRRRRIAVIGVAAAILAGGGLYWYHVPESEPARAARAPARAVPVSVAVASRRDVPIQVTGLGTVQASFTIGIHSQVDGIMQKVVFTEGALQIQSITKEHRAALSTATDMVRENSPKSYSGAYGYGDPIDHEASQRGPIW